MPFKSFLRGDSSVELSEVEEALEEYYDVEDLEASPIDGDNWLSVPLVVDDEYFVKVVTPQNTYTHSVFTLARNIGARVAGSMPFFESFDSPLEMAEHELKAAERMRKAGVNAPEPLDVVPVDGSALLVFEYLDGFHTLGDVDVDEEILEEVFVNLRRLHENGLAHGDFSLENVLVVDDHVYFIDATNLSNGSRDDAVSYDLACAIGALSTQLPPSEVVAAAFDHYSEDDVVHAADFLVVVRLRPGIPEGFDVAGVREAIEDEIGKPL